MKKITGKLESRELFLRYSRDSRCFGLHRLSPTYYALERPGKQPHKIRTMLSDHEIALCYSVARSIWAGGAIVDLGPLMGASTWAFARGLAERSDCPGEPVIHSFDLWRSISVYDDYLQGIPKGGAGSVLGEWMRALDGYLHLCEPHQGDFLKWKWDGRHIGVLFVDIAKSWPLNDHVVSSMFPCLRPGSILIQQDYIHWNEYWTHIEMARFRKYFRLQQFLRGSSALYECVAQPPAELCRTPASALSYEEQVALLEEERALAPASIGEVMKTAAAKHAIENGDFARANLLLDSVSFEPLTDNPLIEVSGIARSNHAQVAAMLARVTE